ncbi:MAG: class I SAM-dependent methyltransferase [Syntrophobacteria bacterium]
MTARKKPITRERTPEELPLYAMNGTSPERDAAFARLTDAYQGFYRSLRRSGGLPYRSTRSGMWAASDAKEVYSAFCFFGLDRYTHMADLGSGDGKVVLIASLFTRAAGYEIDQELYRTSVRIRDELNLPYAEFFQQDYLEADLSSYDLLYLYPDKPLYALEEKLRVSWCGCVLVKGHHMPPRHLRNIAESPRETGRFVLYELNQRAHSS